LLVDRVVEHGGILFGPGIQADTLELQRVEQVIDVQIVRIGGAENFQQVLLAELFRVMAQVGTDSSFVRLFVSTGNISERG